MDGHKKEIDGEIIEPKFTDAAFDEFYHAVDKTTGKTLMYGFYDIIMEDDHSWENKPRLDILPYPSQEDADFARRAYAAWDAAREKNRSRG